MTLHCPDCHTRMPWRGRRKDGRCDPCRQRQQEPVRVYRRRERNAVQEHELRARYGGDRW